jgi:hypothetical protein
LRRYAVALIHAAEAGMAEAITALVHAVGERTAVDFSLTRSARKRQVW